MIFYFDGSCVPNPGKMAVAVVIDQPESYFYEKLDFGTNNEAEWISLLLALDIAHSYNIDEPVICGDSTLVVNQATGVWKCKNETMRKYLDEYNISKKRFKNITLKFVPREFNLAGHYIEKLHKK